MDLILLALLPMPPKLRDSRSSIVSTENNVVIYCVLATILGSLVELGKSGMILDCADGQRRHCFPVLCGWIADHMEYVLLHNLKINACPRCEVPPERLGDSPSNLNTSRNYRKYQKTAKRYQDTGDARHLENIAQKGLK